MTELPKADSVDRLSVARQSLLNLAMRVVGVFLGIVVAAALSRGLGPAGYGEVALALGASALLSQLVDFGFSQTAVKEMAKRPSDADGVAVAAAVLRGFLGFIAASGMVVAAFALSLGWDPWLVLIAALFVPLSATGGLSGVLQARLRIGLQASLNLAKSAVWASLVLLLMSRGVGPLAVLIVLLLVEQATAAVTAWYIVKHRPFRPAGWKHEIRPLVRTSLSLGLLGAGTTIYYKADSLMVFRYAGAESAGYYAAAYRFIDVAQLVPSVLVIPLLPMVAIALANGQTALASRLAQQAFVAALSFGLPFAAAMPFVSNRLVRLVYGEDFAPAAHLASILSVAFVFMSVGWIGMTIVIALNGTGHLWVLSWALAVGTVVAGLRLIPRYGATSAAWISVGVEFIVGTTVMVIAMQRLGAWLTFGTMCRIGILVLATASVQFAMSSASIWLSLLLGGCIYLPMLLLLRLLPPEVFRRLRAAGTRGAPERKTTS
jgi:O-antigen/teichoic acid export membrane protein